MFARFFRTAPALWWGVLLPLSAALSWFLAALHLPASVLLGFMVGGIVLTSRDIRLQVPSALFAMAQGVLGCLMAEAYGADVRLVAFMQYLRVAVVTATAALVARLWTPHGAAAVASAAPWFGVSSVGHVGWTLLRAFGGAIVARRLRVPAGPMMLPLVIGIGWSIGYALPAPFCCTPGARCRRCWGRFLP